jgi:hypothetical protein
MMIGTILIIIMIVSNTVIEIGHFICTFWGEMDANMINDVYKKIVTINRIIMGKKNVLMRRRNQNLLSVLMMSLENVLRQRLNRILVEYIDGERNTIKEVLRDTIEWYYWSNYIIFHFNEINFQFLLLTPFYC